MMDLRETLSVAIDALRGNKLRAILTSLGVIIGSASIVLVVTVALTSRKFVLSQIEATGSNLVWAELDRKSTRLNSSHLVISYAVFCLKKKKHQLCLPPLS